MADPIPTTVLDDEGNEVPVCRRCDQPAMFGADMCLVCWLYVHEKSECVRCGCITDESQSYCFSCSEGMREDAEERAAESRRENAEERARYGE